VLKTILAISLVFLAAGIAACSDGGGTISIPAQQWNGMIVRIETHPNPPLAGMSEIVVIITTPRGKPAGDLTVSLRGNDSVPWVQAIQDGFIGVYRRAVDIGDSKTAVVQVRLQQGAAEKVLLFPFNLAAG
jgi:hypothetical protein